MDTLLLSFRARCLEAMLDLLWRQWCSLGVAGHSGPAAENHLIDPEALALATVSVGRHDARLFDEALDWLRKYGSLINLQRLKNLQRSTGLGDESVLCGVAAWLASHAAQPRWKALARSGSNRKLIQPLFLGIKGSPAHETDPVFLAQGLARSPVQMRGMSRAPRPIYPPNLMIALRALIGVSARVEVILCLAGGAPAHASEIARLTCYAPRTLQALLQEMTLSGHLLIQEPSGFEKVRKGANRRYHLQPTDWAFLTNGRPLPQWLPWAAIFSLGRQVLTAIPAPGEKGRHPAVISSKLRESLVTHGQALASAGLLPALDLRPEAPGDELLRTLAEHLPAAIARL
jgi:hypothetical protein